MAEPSADRLALLYRVSQTFNSSLDLDEVLNYVMDEVIAATRAERGCLMLRDEDGALRFRAARGMDQRTIDDAAFQVSRGVVERVAEDGQPLLTSNALSDMRLRTRDSVVMLGLRSILCVPLQVKGTTLGVIYVDNRLQSGLFRPDDLELLTAIAASAGVAIENARLYQVAVDQGRLERELQVARDVQVSLLPHDTPRLSGWEFVARWQPARQVAGDFYDFIPLDGRLGLLIADVSDKGMPAALFMALSRSTVRASVAQAMPPAEAIAHANRLICADSNGMFVTLFYAQLDPTTGSLLYVNAGHNPPLWYRAAEQRLEPLSTTGMPLGLFDQVEFGQVEARLAAGDFLVLYTDGVTEAMDAQGREFGSEELERLVLHHRADPPHVVAAALDRALSDHIGATAPSDDITFVIARRID